MNEQTNKKTRIFEGTGKKTVAVVKREVSLFYVDNAFQENQKQLSIGSLVLVS